ncbi:MAG TPA: putative glycoside hydrolase, partial [Polyangia bacterium]|nr:putative glycoside hydrolase [Polyangia bacterium]
MRIISSLCALLCMGALARAASFPPGVTYPLTPAALQPSGLAQPLPSTRRYVLVWKDQLIPDSYSSGQIDFVVTHYVGTQKLFKRQIDSYRVSNPNFLMLTYHLAYGLNGADQANPVGNITAADVYGQEDTDTFTPYVAAHSITRENAYQHSANPGTTANRVSYPDPYWLMDISSTEWRSYTFDTLLQWQSFPSANATGVFLDVAFPPWYNYSPAMWWAVPAGDGTRAGLDAWWQPRARAYFDAMRTAFAPTAQHPRYLVIPNPDALVDGTDEPAFLDGTDGVFTENWQAVTASPGDWNLSARRICRYVTGAGKVWMADVTTAGTSLSQADREFLIGSYFVLRNGTSYVMFGNGDLTWYPEYEIDLGGYVAEPPSDLESLRVAGAGGASGGLYARDYVRGVALVNSSSGALAYTVASPMKRAAWSGGGVVAGDGSLPQETLTYDVDVPAGTLMVPARSTVILRDPAGAPPPGEEPGGAGGGGDMA